MIVSRWLIVCSILCFSLLSQAQNQKYYPEVNHPNWFKAIPMLDENTPEWAKVMYEEDTAFRKIIDLKADYDATHNFVKDMHVRNYKFWRKTVEAYVNENGYVEFPKPGELFAQAEKKKSSIAQKSSPPEIWSCVGPFDTYQNNDSQNKQLNQANVYCLGVAASNTNVVYAGMETGGVFKTIDKGMSWFPVSYDYGIGNLQDIKVDPTDEDIVYICRDHEIYKTSDGGVTWALNYVANSRVEQLLINPTNTDIIYAATQNGVLKTSNAGGSWSSIFAGYFYDIQFKPGVSSTLYVAMKNNTTKRPEIYKSTNSGSSWTLKDAGYYSPSNLNVATIFGCKIGVTPANPDRVYAGIIATGKEGDQGWIGVYYSNDSGENWQEDSGFDGGPYESGNDASTNWYVAGYSDGYHQGFYNFDLDVSHTDPDKFWIGTIWFCESANKGGNFEYIRNTRSLPMHADIQDIDVVGNEIWVSSDGGINYSNDECQTMEVRSSGITASDYWGYGQGWNEDIWYGGRYHNGNSIYFGDYGFGNTIYLGGAENATGYVHQLDNRKVYASDIGGRKIPASIGESATNITNLGLYPKELYYNFAYSDVEWHPNYGNVLFLGRDNQFYKSIDSGINFESIYTFPGEVFQFEISRDDPNYIYAIVVESYYNHFIYRSTNGGQSFTKLPVPPISGGNWRNLSIAINPFDKNEIWTGSNNSTNGNKIFNSIDGGQTWTNRYDVLLADESILDIVFHAGTYSNTIYVMTNNDYFYYEAGEGSWIPFNSGLPVQHGGFKSLAFYKDAYLRMASNKGIWQADLIQNSKIQAMPMVSMDSIFCSRDTLYLESYSIIPHDGASWEWMIDPAPVYVSDLNVRNPKVVLGQSGDYDIQLLINGGDGQMDTSMVESMVHVDDFCTSDTIPGQALISQADGDGLEVSDFNQSNLTHFSVTGWWKPEGLQAFGALFSSGDWCAHCDYTEGLIVDYWGSKLWYKWPGNASYWGSNSGMVIPDNEWSYVALVIEPTGATLYLNEQKYEHNIPLNPGDIENLNIGFGHYSYSFHGLIDEVTVWKRALTEAEVRSMRHLTKEDQINSDPDLLAYYQFNGLVGGRIMDHAGTHHGFFKNGSSLVESTAPIGSGKSETYTVTGPMSIQSGVDLDIDFPASGTYPNGDIVLNRIHVAPNVYPSNKPSSKYYWIVNNYGSNSNFSPLSSMTFHALDLETSGTPASSYGLFGRNRNSNLEDWTLEDTGDAISNDVIVFSGTVPVTEFGQFIITNQAANGWIGVKSTQWNDPFNWGDGIVPNNNSNVIIPALKPFDPMVNVDSTIRSLKIQNGANIGILQGKHFTILQ